MPRKAAKTSHKIVGGADAESGDLPWQAAYAVGNGNQYFVICGGTLVAERWVVTAAHCTYGKAMDGTGQRVYLGAHNLANVESTRSDFDVTQVIEHPDYDDDATTNDIALLKLGQPVVYTDYIQPACLPAQGQDPIVGQECLASGWGALEEDGPTPDILQVVSLPIISNQQCADLNNAAILDHMICAGIEEGGIDACQGDSGGPLVCGDSTGYTLHGVTSWGFGCARPERPGVYTRMADFVDWTIQNMEDNQGPGFFELPMTDCGTVISNDQILRLPVDQNEYKDNWSCSWTISAPTGASGVRVTFLHRFWIEVNTNGECYDTLTFSQDNGNDDSVFCGDKLPDEQYFSFADSSSVDVSFVSDGSVGGLGFAASIEFAFE